MIRIMGLSLSELSLLAAPPASERLTPEQNEKNRVKALRSGDSILGRELLHHLTRHSCERGCDSFTLSFAEELATKRRYNPNALGFFIQNFAQNFHRHRDVIENDEELSFIFFERGAPAEAYLARWLTIFIEKGIEVLQGDLAASELFGNGYFYEMWESFIERVHAIDDDNDVVIEPVGEDHE